LADDASLYLATARRVALAHFDKDQVQEIPLLVVQIAQLMATLEQRQALKEQE
jgi:hypothetical protein